MLRVGIDGRAFASPAAGVRRYIKGLTRALLALGAPLELIALGGLDASAFPPGVGHITEPPHPPTNLGWTLVGLPRAAAEAKIDVLHAPAYTAPFWSPAPVVLTVHDVSYERNPEWYPYRRDWLRRAFYRRSARSADHILTVSWFSASEIAAMYALPAERISVVPLGVSNTFAGRDALPCELPAAVTTPFLLHVGDIHERRNLAVAVNAVLEARRHFGSLPALSLVLVGTDRGTGDALSALAAAAGVPEAVVRLGRVEEVVLHALYRCATGFVYPSRYEGFGLPVLEAMASGLPVIASRVASIPELTGDAAILLDPDDDRGWIDAIIRLATDDELRRELAARGIARAALFTWARTARGTMEVYHNVAARR